jgi:hypothetical protein
MASIAFRIEPPPKTQTDFETRFTEQQIGLLEKLNRRSPRYLRLAERIVIPEIWSRDPLDYSPLPTAYDGAASYTKVLVVHQPSQVFGAYERGVLVRWGPVSSGREEFPTPSGAFHLNWRSRGRHSTINPRWYMPWYFNFHNRRGLALHAYDLPGRPASHACIRLLEDDARWLFDWGRGWTLDEKGWQVLQLGTPVMILGHYDFQSPPPWLSHEWLARGVQLPAELVASGPPSTRDAPMAELEIGSD